MRTPHGERVDDLLPARRWTPPCFACVRRLRTDAVEVVATLRAAGYAIEILSGDRAAADGRDRHDARRRHIGAAA